MNSTVQFYLRKLLKKETASERRDREIGETIGEIRMAMVKLKVLRNEPMPEGTWQVDFFNP